MGRMIRPLAMVLAVLLMAGPLSAAPSPTPSPRPADSPTPTSPLVLTDAQLKAIVQEAMDKAVAPERKARLAAEAKLRAWERAAPWIVTGCVGLAATTFVLGFTARK